MPRVVARGPKAFGAYAAAPIRCLIFIAVFAAVIAFPFSAEAMNLDYLEPTKWKNNENITFEEIDTDALGETLFGLFGYYVDDNMCLYTYFSVDGSNVAEAAENARIVYYFHTPSEEYAVEVDKDGISGELPEEQRVFNVKSNFEYSGSGVFIAAAEYDGDEDNCLVDIYFYADKAFKIAESVPVERPIVTKPEKTTEKKEHAETAKKATEKATKSGASATEKSRSGAVSATKYTPKGNNYISEAEETEGEYTDENDTILENPVSENAVEAIPQRVMSKDAKLLLAIAASLAVMGGVFVAAYFVKNKKPAAAPDGAPEESDSTPE